MGEILLIFLEKILEAIYFSLFLIIGKNLKKKRLLFVLIMVFEYLLLKSVIRYNVLFQFVYTFMMYVNLKVLYKEKAQITDIFLFAAASIMLIFISIISYSIVLLNPNNYYLALIVNRILMFLLIFVFRKTIREKYVEFYSLWNRHNNPNKTKSLTVRNLSVIIFNLMFWLINLGIVFVRIFG